MPRVLSQERIGRLASFGRAAYDDPERSSEIVEKLDALTANMASIAQAVATTNDATSQAVLALIGQNAEIIRSLQGVPTGPNAETLKAALAAGESLSVTVLKRDADKRILECAVHLIRKEPQ